MGAKATLRYNKGLERFTAFVQRLRRGDAKRLNSRAAFSLATRIKQMVKDQYRNQAGSLPQTTRQMAKAGKDQGHVAPPIPPKNAKDPYLELARAVKVTVLQGHGYRIEIDPQARQAPVPRPEFPAGLPLGLLAYWMENPRPTIIPVTLRMMVYFKVLREGEGGYNTKKTTKTIAKNFEIGDSIIIHPRERPVWRSVAARLVSKEMLALYTRDLARRVRTLAKQFGFK